MVRISSRSRSLGSSPSPPNIIMIIKVTAYEKKKLKERLRKLDRQLYRFYWFNSGINFAERNSMYTNRAIFPDMYKKLIKLDEKRKEIRNKLK